MPRSPKGWAEKSSTGRVPPAIPWIRIGAAAVPLLVSCCVGVSAFVPGRSQIVVPALARACAAVSVLNGAACVPALLSLPFVAT